jgi:hypothetical protein
MSLSNPVIKNPAVKFIEFKGETGIFQYYDKENEKNSFIPLPLFFIVLDELHTVRGYNQRLKAGITSNEVRNIKTDIMSIKVFKSDIKIVGIWDQIKDEVGRNQGHYSKSVYAALIKSRTEIELVNFQMHGASRAPWFDFKGDKEKFGVSVYETVDDNTGNVSFKRPVFKSVKINQDVFEKAIALDIQLQSYLKQYLSKGIDISVENKESGLIYENKTQEEKPENTNPVIYPEDNNYDEMIPKTDDLPF